MTDEKRIALTMASYGGVSPEILHSHILMAAKFSRTLGWKYHPFIVGRMLMGHACNTVLDLMEQMEDRTRETFTHVLWLDDDVGLNANDAVRLIECVDSEHPAVYALAFFRQPPYNPSLWRDKSLGKGDRTLQKILDYPKDQLVKVAAAGLCAAAFDRRVFKALKKPYFVFEEKGYNKASCTPDGWLCYKLGTKDIPIHVHTGIKATHMGFPQRVTEEFALQYKDQWTAE